MGGRSSGSSGSSNDGGADFTAGLLTGWWFWGGAALNGARAVESCAVLLAKCSLFSATFKYCVRMLYDVVFVISKTRWLPGYYRRMLSEHTPIRPSSLCIYTSIFENDTSYIYSGIGEVHFNVQLRFVLFWICVNCDFTTW